jgi:hypothetical protein
MNSDVPGAQEQKAPDAARQAARIMTLAGLAIMALGVVYFFLPAHGSHLVHKIAGIVVVAGGLFVAGWGAQMRRRLR